jgi:FMN phosphatase YigB (HAD superfamily)
MECKAVVFDLDGTNKCLNFLGIKKSESMFVGNGEEDIIARNAQVFDVLLKRGEYEFTDIQPSLTINSLYDLRNLLEIQN